jgi:hypothetical protein
MRVEQHRQLETSKALFWCKVFKTRYDIVVALCDEELLGKQIKVKKLKIKISEDFYGGKLVEEKIALALLKKATIGNLFGKKIVELAQKNGFIAKENVISFNEIPHAQFVKLEQT